MSTNRGSRDHGRERLARVGLAPRGLDRIEAAAYVGVAGETFDAMVADGRMPSPRVVGARRIFDRLELDRHFDVLPHVTGSPAHAGDVDDVWSRARV